MVPVITQGLPSLREVASEGLPCQCYTYQVESDVDVDAARTPPITDNEELLFVGGVCDGKRLGGVIGELRIPIRGGYDTYRREIIDLSDGGPPIVILTCLTATDALDLLRLRFYKRLSP